MNPNNIYIFNPAYILKNDVTRIIITNEKGKFYSDLVEVDITDSFLNFIHPIHAILLSYFDGINSYGEIVNTCSDLFDLSKNEITEIIDKFILNKDELKIFFNDFLFCFPKNILIPFQSKFNQRNFNFNDYKINYEYQNYNEIRLNKPIDAILMINNQCVTDCIYCYADRNKTMPCKIPFSRLKELIIEAKQLGMRNFDINGGELFLYENWYELLKLFYENCFDPFISTKIPITEKQILKLKELKVKGVQISIDSINEIELAQNVKKDVSYKNSIINTLQLLEKHEISFYTNTVITKYNSSLNTIKNLVEFLLQFKHIKRISLTAAGYSLYKTEVEYLNNKPQLEEIITIKTYIEDIKAKNNQGINIYMGGYSDKSNFFSDLKEKEEKFRKRVSCTGNIENFYILPDGKVTICEELYWHPKFIIGDLMKDSILDVWNSEQAQNIYNLKQDTISPESACHDCAEFKSCRTFPGVCWKQILYAYGNDKWDFPDPRCFKANEPKRVFYL